MNWNQILIEKIDQVGNCLRGGEFIESPFDFPIEEEKRGDPDQRDDDSNFADKNLVISIEKNLPSGKKSIKNISYTPRLFYFLDGSLRTKYLGDYIEGKNAFPILATEVSCSVVKRDGKVLKPHRLEKYLYFIFPHRNTGIISDTLYDKLEILRDNLQNENSLFRIEFLKRENYEFRDIRYSMLGKARDIMHTLEHSVAQSLDLSHSWLIMDGAIRKQEFLTLNNTIGLAKSFSRKPIFDLGDGKTKMITTYLSTIREGERSAVFKKDDVAFWYIRLRTYPPMEPLGGLVKIDFSLSNMPEEGLTDETLSLIDEISAEIYSLRSPSVYPYPRWPSLIYPIRLTEEIMNSNHLNNELIGLLSHRLKKIIGGVSP